MSLAEAEFTQLTTRQIVALHDDIVSLIYPYLENDSSQEFTDMYGQGTTPFAFTIHELEELMLDALKLRGAL